jgi:hypothetical protein
MSKQSAPTPDELAGLRELVALTESQITSIDDLVVALNARLGEASEKRCQLEAELATRRQSLVEWTRSRDVLSKTLQGLTLRARSARHMAHVHNLCLTNPTATPSDAELAQKLVEEENRDLDATRAAIDTRESYISVLRSRVAVLEENIAACSATSSHIESMIALQVPHKNRLQALLGQYKSRLHPLLQLPEGTLRDIFLHVVQLAWEEWKWSLSGDIHHFALYSPSTYSSDPALALAAVCHWWRNVATHTPELWSKFLIYRGRSGSVARLAHYIGLAKGRALSILINFIAEVHIPSLQFIKSRHLKLDTLGLGVQYRGVCREQILRVLPSPRILILTDDEVAFSPVSLSPELLSRTEELYAQECQVSINFPVPTLRRLELGLECKNTTLQSQYISSLLQHLPQLDYLSIRCRTYESIFFPPLPSLLVSPGVCESLTWIQIPLFALVRPLAGLQTSFTLPNLLRLSLLEFLSERSDLESWSNFCRLNGGKINRLDLYFRSDSISSPERHSVELAEHLHCLESIIFLSLDKCLVFPLLIALGKNIEAEEGKKEHKLLLPNMETCKLLDCVLIPGAMSVIEELFSFWAKKRNVKRKGEATGQPEVVTVLWK